MKPVKIHIPTELFEPAEIRTFSGETLLENVTIGADVYELQGPCTWNVEITNTGGAFLVRGSVQAEGVCDCARCLAPAHVSFDGAIEGYFVVSSDEQDEELEGDEYEFLPEDHDIDIAPLILQGLMLDAPLQPLCRDDCKGICPQCGQDLNEGSCGCASKPHADAMNPFAVLKDLKL